MKINNKKVLAAWEIDNPHEAKTEVAYLKECATVEGEKLYGLYGQRPGRDKKISPDKGFYTGEGLIAAIEETLIEGEFNPIRIKG